MSDAPKAARARGYLIRIGRNYYTQWTVRIWWRGLTIEHGGYGTAVPWWKLPLLLPFVVKCLRGLPPWDEIPEPQ